MKNKRLLVKRNQFCEYLNAMLTERLRQALCAEEVILTNGKFIIIEEYEVTESYYGHQLVQPIGCKISVLNGLCIVLNHMIKKKLQYCISLSTLKYSQHLLLLRFTSVSLPMKYYVLMLIVSQIVWQLSISSM